MFLRDGKALIFTIIFLGGGVSEAEPETGKNNDKLLASLIFQKQTF